MSANARPETQAFEELETLVRHLGEELAAFRRRALTAEAQVKEAGHSSASKGRSPLADRLAELETENADLRARVSAAEDRVRQVMDRVHFLRQQLQTQAGTASVAR